MELNNIHIFCTNISSENDKELIGEVLNNHPDIHQWSIDQDDIDCVLRVVSNSLAAHQIIDLISQQNYICNELE